MAEVRRFSSDLAGFRERLLRMRTLRGWDQATLGDMVGSNASLISHIERGRKDPPAGMVEQLAAAFGCTSGYLTGPPSVRGTTDPWLRAYADASKRETSVRVAAAATASEYIRLLKLERIGEMLPDAPDDLDDPAAIDDVAIETRELLGLGGDAVVSNAVRAAERLGCVVMPLDTELGRHMGMSLRSEGMPMMFVAKAGSGDRQRFTVAHEIGHLVLHSGEPPPRNAADANRMERQANAFAAAFLTPGDAVIETLHENGGRVVLQALAEIKAVWGVSIKMLVGRFRGLGIIDEEQARSLYKQISARRWTKAEPVDVPLEQAQWFAYRVTEKAGTSDLKSAAGRLAEQVGGAAIDLHSFVDWTEPAPGEVIDMASRR